MKRAVDPADHLGLVYSAAHRYTKLAGIGVELDDLVQEGALGLMKAADKFDPTRGIAFSTYAGWWISAYIVHYIRDSVRRSRLVSSKEIDRRRAAGEPMPPRPRSLDRSVTSGPSHKKPMGDPSDLTLHEVLSDPNAPNPEREVEKAETRALLALEVGKLTGREREILRLRFVDELTLEQVGEGYGLTRERIRQIEKQALDKLRPRLEKALT